jgi:hypothetical protein
MAKRESIDLGRGFRVRKRGWSYCTDFSVGGRRYRRCLKTASKSEAIAKAYAIRASLFPSPVEFVANLLPGKPAYGSWRHSEGWARKVLKQARSRAKAKSLPFDLVVEDVADLAEQCGGACAVTRLPFIVDNKTPYRVNPFTPSLDRVSSSGGYTRGNVRLVCMCVNIALSQWGDGVFSLMAKGYVKALLDHPAVSPENVTREGLGKSRHKNLPMVNEQKGEHRSASY